MGVSQAPAFVTAAQFGGLISYPEAIGTLEEVLRTGLAVRTPLRTQTDLSNGHLLYMPAQVGGFVGVKIASVSPTNHERDLPRINGLLILSDSLTLQPVMIFDAAELTVLRTAALSAVAVQHLAPAAASTLVVFGTGPQAWGHIQAINAVRPLRKVVIVGRSVGPSSDLVARVSATGLAAEAGAPGSVAEADIVACCTSATSPLFDSAALKDDATVVAIGSHSPRAREVDTSLVRRAFVVVETRASAFAEAGDILLACSDGIPREQAVNAELADVVREPRTNTAGLRLFKGVGEAWADVAIASAAAMKLGSHPQLQTAR
ncbi:ornithine cyclodeaminase family protein [Mycolicibacterium mengxianglii]|uniref:ornithine cyclodeaminase family protein n=1 Tax=Mycolicibacterium mengxianglii TaxID=2736649 RepID=UPI0018EEDAF4|nr:ornithine cyclodeaminase family protein [Mycolicibacterium mengxianglii]